MIGKGNQHNNGVKLARYLMTGKDGERAELFELCGFASSDIVDAFASVHVMAEATKCTQPFFHVQVRNPAGENMPDDHWRRAADRIESILGLKEQPRAITFHIDEQTGDRHMHVAWSRIDEENLKAKNLSFFKLRLKRVSRELEQELGLTLVANERPGKISFAPSRDEDEQARRNGIDIHKMRETIRACYDGSEGGRGFEAALAHEGLMLAKGDRRNYVVIDEAGGIYALSKRILGVTAGQSNTHLSDLASDESPSVDQARAYLVPAKSAEKQLHPQVDNPMVSPKPEPQPQPAPGPQQKTSENLADLDRLIFGTLLDKLIRDPYDEEIRTLMWQLPDALIDDINQSAFTVHEAQVQPSDLDAIRKLIAERNHHSFTVEASETDRQLLLHRRAPVFAFIGLQLQNEQRQKEIERLDPLIYGGLLRCAVDNPEQRNDVNLLAWQMPHEFMVALNENISAVASAQALQLNSIDIKKLIVERNRLGHQITLAEIDKIVAEHSPAPELWDRDAANQAWEDAVTDAAIKFEQSTQSATRGKSRAGEGGKKEKGAGQPRIREADELNRIQGQIRLAFNLGHSAEGFIRNLEELAQREQQLDEFRPGRYRMADRIAVLARVNGEDAAGSRIDQRYATDRPFVRMYRAGDYIVLTEQGREYSVTAATGRKGAEIEKFMATANPKAVPTLAEARQQIEKRGKIRQIERQTFAALNGIGSLQPSWRVATDAVGNHSISEPTGITTGQLGRAASKAKHDLISTALGVEAAIPKAVRGALSPLSALGKLGDALGSIGDGLASLIAPTLSPAQKRDGEIASLIREAQGQNAAAFSRFTSDQAQDESRQQEQAVPDWQREPDRDR